MAGKFLWISPLPPVRSGVSDYAVEILRPLSRLADFRILAPPAPEIAPELPADLADLLVPFETEPEPDRLIVAHFGNNPYHQWILDFCRGRPVVAVAHDLVLHHLLVHDSMDTGAGIGVFTQKMRMAHGNSGEALAEARAFGLSGHLDPFLFPGLKAVLGDVRALICHSEFGRQLLAQNFPEKPVLAMKLPVEDPGILDRTIIRRKLGISESDILMMHLGFLTPEKGLGAVLGGLAAARICGVDARLLLVGEDDGSSDLISAASRLGIESAVTSTGWLPWAEMIEAPAAADIGVALRVPSAGETSAAVLRFLACGTPVAVVAQRQFLEWPPEIAPRITPGPSMSAEIGRLLTRVSDDNEWNLRRPAVRKVYEDGHTPAQGASTMMEFLRVLS